MAWIHLEHSRAPGLKQRFLVPHDGIRLPLVLKRSAARACKLSIGDASGVNAVDLIGYIRPASIGRRSRLGLRGKFNGQRVAPSPPGVRTVRLPAGGAGLSFEERHVLSSVKMASASKSVPVVAQADNPPPRPAAIYNPLRPAAANAAATPALAPGAKARAAALAAKVQVVKSSTVAGFACDDRVLGTGGSAAREGQKALLRFTIRSANDEKKVVEKGEIWCRLGEAEVMDGYVDGNVDMEDVLGRWGRAVVGMQVGGARRVRIPKKSSFKGDKGEDLPAGDLLFDVNLKQIKS